MKLTYELCDDWLIFARDQNGNRYYVITEMWPEWLDLPSDAAYEPDAIERYMLPVAMQKWDNLNWQPVEN